MDRDEARELFSAYRDGDLGPEQARALEGLLEEDEECRAEYEGFCRVLDRLAGLGRATAPPDFAEKLKGRIRRRSAGRFFGARTGPSLTRVPFELFSLVLILIILTVYLLTVPMVQVSRPAAAGGGGEETAPELRR